MPRRRICFVTGTRAEFGLMRTVLRRIADHPKLSLQLLVTGMHLDRSRGYSVDEIRKEEWPVNAIVPWRASDRSQTSAAIETGNAIAGMARAFDRLNSEIVLVTGDRVEAFAAAAAAHIGGRIVAHVHGGDRALGLVDDSLRHAVTKLAHIHFPATMKSAQRLAKLGEDRWRIFRAGSPGLDEVRRSALPRLERGRRFPDLKPRQFALLVLHPQSPREPAEAKIAKALVNSLRATGIGRIAIVYPNNDPGSAAIVRQWDSLVGAPDVALHRNLPREIFLGLLRDAAMLVGNSSSGIIEAASFGTPVIDVGDRQLGRERGENVLHVPQVGAKLNRGLAKVWNKGAPVRFASNNIYGSGGAGKKIATILAGLNLARFHRKLIAY